MRGLQKVTDKLRGKNQSVDERDEKIEPPPGSSDVFRVEDAGVRRSSRQTKNKEPHSFENPVK